jgi:hypothetical protein
MPADTEVDTEADKPAHTLADTAVDRPEDTVADMVALRTPAGKPAAGREADIPEGPADKGRGSPPAP